MKIKWVMPKRGLEPPLPDGNYTLNVARLPIPPLRQVETENVLRRCTEINSVVTAIFYLAIRTRLCQGDPPPIAQDVLHPESPGLSPHFFEDANQARSHQRAKSGFGRLQWIE